MDLGSSENDLRSLKMQTQSKLQKKREQKQTEKSMKKALWQPFKKVSSDIKTIGTFGLHEI